MYKNKIVIWWLYEYKRNAFLHLEAEYHSLQLAKS